MAPSIQDVLDCAKILKPCLPLDGQVQPDDFINDTCARLDLYRPDLSSQDKIPLIADKFSGEARFRWISMPADSRPKTIPDLHAWIRNKSGLHPWTQYTSDKTLIKTAQQTGSMAEFIELVRPAQQRLLSNPVALQDGFSLALLVSMFINSLHPDIAAQLRRKRVSAASDPFTSLAALHDAALQESLIHSVASNSPSPDFDQTSVSSAHDHDHFDSSDYLDPPHDTGDYDQDFQDYDNYDHYDSASHEFHDSASSDLPDPHDQGVSDEVYNLASLTAALVYQLQQRPGYYNPVSK